MLRHEHFGGADDMRGLGEIDLARGADQAAVLGRAVDEKPGIDRDAMAADAGAWLEDVDARVAVGEADHLPNVDAHVLGHHRQLVGKGDVDVAIRSEEHTSELQSLMRISYAVFCLKKKNKSKEPTTKQIHAS